MDFKKAILDNIYSVVELLYCTENGIDFLLEDTNHLGQSKER